MEPSGRNRWQPVAGGRGRYLLWTGDVGTALFAAACLEADARYPIIDVV